MINYTGKGCITILQRIITDIKNFDNLSRKQQFIYNAPCWVIMIIICVILFKGCNNSADQHLVNEPVQAPIEEVQEVKEEPQEEVKIKESKPYTLKFGDLVSTFDSGDTLIVKAKIEHVGSNKYTIDQNGYNIEDLILNQNVADKYNSIQYWAVAAMSDGSEEKVISFTIDKPLIDKIKNKNVVANQIINNASDVWIIQSLK